MWFSRGGEGRHRQNGALTRQTPYGILGLLLGPLRLPAGEMPSLTAVLQTVGRNLAVATSDGTPVVVVDNAESADQWSALALAELARSGVIRVVLVCRRINDTAHEFAQLWRTGQLLRIEVQPLNCGETRAFLAQEVGGPCSLAAATRLWQETFGNPLYLKAMIAAEVGDGALSSRDGVWIWQELRMSHAVPSGVGNLTRLMNADGGNWEILETVSLVGAIPVAGLMEIYPPGDVDALQESDDLAFAGSGKSLVSLAHPVLASLLPRLVSADHGLRLRLAVETVKLRQHQPEAQAERVTQRAFASLSSAAQITNGAATAAAADPAGSGLWGVGPSAASAGTDQDMAVLAERSNRMGEETLARDLLHCHAQHAQSTARHAAELALAGNQDDALNLAAALNVRMGLSGSGSPATLSAEPLERGLVGPLMSIFAVSGEWQQMDELMAACQERGTDADLVDSALLEVAHGLFEAFRGNHSQASQLLTQGSAQLHYTPVAGWDAAARIAEHYCRAVVDRSAVTETGSARSLQTLLAEVVASPAVPRLFRTLAQCLVGKSLLLGAEDLQILDKILPTTSTTDLPSQRMLVLATRASKPEAAFCDDLILVAGAQEGDLAEVLGVYAKGVLAQDSTVLVQVVEMACTMNYPVLAAGAARQALSFASPASIRGVRRQLQRLVELPGDLSDQAGALNARWRGTSTKFTRSCRSPVGVNSGHSWRSPRYGREDQ